MIPNLRVLYILFFITLCTYCTDYTYLFRKNAEGVYRVINSNQYFTIDSSGNMAGTPETEMFFYQAKSDTDAIYRKKENKVNKYVPIRLDGNDLYYDEKELSEYNVSFNDMILFAKKN